MDRLKLQLPISVGDNNAVRHIRGPGSGFDCLLRVDKLVDPRAYLYTEHSLLKHDFKSFKIPQGDCIAALFIYSPVVVVPN